jgi:hypothetical protein
LPEHDRPEHAGSQVRGERSGRRLERRQEGHGGEQAQRHQRDGTRDGAAATIPQSVVAHRGDQTGDRAREHHPAVQHHPGLCGDGSLGPGDRRGEQEPRPAGDGEEATGGQQIALEGPLARDDRFEEVADDAEADRAQQEAPEDAGSDTHDVRHRRRDGALGVALGVIAGPLVFVMAVGVGLLVRDGDQRVGHQRDEQAEQEARDQPRFRAPDHVLGEHGQ